MRHRPDLGDGELRETKSKAGGVFLIAAMVALAALVTDTGWLMFVAGALALMAVAGYVAQGDRPSEKDTDD